MHQHLLTIAFCYELRCVCKIMPACLIGIVDEDVDDDVQVPRLRSKTAALIFREQFDSLLKDTSSALDVIGHAVHQVYALTLYLGA